MRETDRDSFEAWARASQQRLLRAAYLLTGDLQLAEDLLQEALVKAAQRWHTLGAEHPEAWVRRVMYRDHISWWRKHRRERRVAEVPDAERPVVPPEVALVLREALGVLTPRQRAVVVLRYVEDLSTAQTADLLGVSVGTVKKLGSVALARLRTSAPGLADLVEDRS